MLKAKQRIRKTAISTLSVITMGALSLTACIDLTVVAVGTTSKVLERGKYATKQEADFDLAARAIPGSLKTVETFHMVDPGNPRLTAILSEGFCQYASGFIEDEWEQAFYAKDFDGAEYQGERASKSFLRCMGYSLDILGKKWKKTILGSPEEVAALSAKTGWGQRDALMWAAAGLAGSINHNKDNPDLVQHLSKAIIMMDRVIALYDAKIDKISAVKGAAPMTSAEQITRMKSTQWKPTPAKYQAKRATAHLVRAKMHMAIPKALGGKPELGRAHFERGLQITENKFLLIRVLLAKEYGRAMQDMAFFRKQLIQVLQTDPAIWPAQRLANEIAHRRAKRYLKLEKEFF